MMAAELDASMVGAHLPRQRKPLLRVHQDAGAAEGDCCSSGSTGHWQQRQRPVVALAKLTAAQLRLLSTRPATPRALTLPSTLQLRAALRPQAILQIGQAQAPGASRRRRTAAARRKLLLWRESTGRLTSPRRCDVHSQDGHNGRCAQDRHEGSCCFSWCSCARSLTDCKLGSSGFDSNDCGRWAIFDAVASRAESPRIIMMILRLLAAAKHLKAGWNHGKLGLAVSFLSQIGRTVRVRWKHRCPW